MSPLETKSRTFSDGHLLSRESIAGMFDVSKTRIDKAAVQAKLQWIAVLAEAGNKPYTFLRSEDLLPLARFLTRSVHIEENGDGGYVMQTKSGEILTYTPQQSE